MVLFGQPKNKKLWSQVNYKKKYIIKIHYIEINIPYQWWWIRTIHFIYFSKGLFYFKRIVYTRKRVCFWQGNYTLPCLHPWCHVSIAYTNGVCFQNHILHYCKLLLCIIVVLLFICSYILIHVIYMVHVYPHQYRWLGNLSIFIMHYSKRRLNYIQRELIHAI